jgi:hypothetical protein
MATPPSTGEVVKKFEPLGATQINIKTVGSSSQKNECRLWYVVIPLDNLDGE